MLSDQLKGVEQLRPRPLRRLASQLAALVEHRLWLQVLVGMVLGLAVGVALGPAAGWVDPELGLLIGSWLALPGQLFLAAIQMIVVPLVFASIIVGLASSENVEQLKQLGFAVVAFFIATTAVAAGIGLWVGNLISPGQSLGASAASSVPADLAQEVFVTPRLADLPDVMINLLPGNPLGSMVEGEMLQVVIFAAIVGVALVSMAPQQARPMLELLGSLQQVCMTVVRWAMWLAPLAVFGLMARLMTQLGIGAIAEMAKYVFTVLLGLALLLLLYLLIVAVVAKRSPLQFMIVTRELLLLAFSTSSSAAVMPLSIKTAEEKLDVMPSIAQFVIPLGATINMNGTALYQGVATVFLAQVYGIDIGLSGMLLVVALAVGASVGSPATPGVGIVILATVLATVGIPPEGIALIMGVDRILDMSRTAINVAGDLVASMVMNRWVGIPQQQQQAGTTASA
jgi:Na+/H+-dicarboxylate symporter